MITLLSKPLADTFSLQIKQRVALLVDRGVDPQLAVVLVGNDPESVKYIMLKTRVAQELGIILSLYHLEEPVTYEEVAETISFLNGDSEIHGIIVQLPLPQQFSDPEVDSLIGSVHPAKDVDGLTGAWKRITWNARTFQQLVLPQPEFIPPMVTSILSLLDEYSVSLDGKAVIVGEGRLVGGPVSHYLKACGVDTVSVNEETEGIMDITKEADVLISATGEPDLITYQWVKPGATVVDCARDVHLDSVSQVAGALAPSVGGVGPLTVLWLLHNVSIAAGNAENNGGING